MLDPAAPYESLTKLAQTWGNLFSLRLGGLNCVVIADRQLLQEIFRREESSGRAPLYLTHGIMEGRGLICSEGPPWAEQRQWAGAALRSLQRAARRIAWLCCSGSHPPCQTCPPCAEQTGTPSGTEG